VNHLHFIYCIITIIYYLGIYILHTLLSDVLEVSQEPNVSQCCSSSRSNEYPWIETIDLNVGTTTYTYITLLH